MSSTDYLPVEYDTNEGYYYVTIKHIIHPNAVIYKKGESDNHYTELGTTRDNSDMVNKFEANTFFIDKNKKNQYQITIGGGRKSKRSRKSYSSKKRALKSRRIRKSSRRYSRRR